MKTMHTMLYAALAAGMISNAAAAPWVYRGSLSDGGNEANGQYDLRVTLLGANGHQLAAPVTLFGVRVQKGEFQTDVDFGVDIGRYPGAKVKTEVQQGSSGFVQLGDAKAVPNLTSTQAGVCWDTDGNAGVATSVLGTNDAASETFTRLRARGETKLYLRAGGGIENQTSSALGLDSVAMGSSTAEGAGSFTIGGGRTGISALSSFAFSDSVAPEVPFTPGYSNEPGEFLVNASGGMAIHAVPSGYGSLGPEVTDLTIGVKSSGTDTDVDIVLKARNGQTGAIAYLEDGSFSLQSTPTGARFIRTGANGAFLSPGGVWTNGSSRTFKMNFTPVNPLDILRKVAAMPVSTWRYKNSTEGLHVGPMAEDFKAAFGLGTDEEHIGTVDADGVALAAIQGLNIKLDAAEQENAALVARLEALEAKLAQ